MNYNQDFIYLDQSLVGLSLVVLDQSLPVKPGLEDFWNLEMIGISISKRVKKSDDMTAFENFSQCNIKMEGTVCPGHGNLNNYNFRTTRMCRLIDSDCCYIDLEISQECLKIMTKSWTNNVKMGPSNGLIWIVSMRTTWIVTCHIMMWLMRQSQLLRLGLYMMILWNPKVTIRIWINVYTEDQLCWKICVDFYSVSVYWNLIIKNVQIYRFSRVPCGIISSPFLLAATIDLHFQKYRNPVAEKIRDSIYVDNLLTGIDAKDKLRTRRPHSHVGR